jgi:hypothetical protein
VPDPGRDPHGPSGCTILIFSLNIFIFIMQGFKKGLDAMGCHSLEQVVQNRASLIANLTKVTHGLVPPSPLARAIVLLFGYFAFRSLRV